LEFAAYVRLYHDGFIEALQAMLGRTEGKAPYPRPSCLLCPARSARRRGLHRLASRRTRQSWRRSSRAPGSR
jgi:hypothetical protein